MTAFHQPVLLTEVLDGFQISSGQVFLDATLGGAGHSRAVAERLGPQGHLVGLDHDDRALEAAAAALNDVPCKVTLVRENFSHIAAVAQDLGLRFDGVLADLGVSSHHLDDAGRGFTYWGASPLDMRMDLRRTVTAEAIVNTWDEGALCELFRTYGEERFAPRIARQIVRRREREPIRTADVLVDIIKAGIPARFRRHGGHPARRVFQALRIAVNEELQALEQFLDALPGCMRPGGRAGIISYHSLEDRAVKWRFRSPPFSPVTRKPIVPGETECQENPRARSAKLRFADVLFEQVEE